VCRAPDPRRSRRCSAYSGLRGAAPKRAPRPVHNARLTMRRPTRSAIHRPPVALGLTVLAAALTSASCSSNTSGTCFDRSPDDGCAGRRETLCLSTSACAWQPACVDACANRATAEHCEGAPACRWNDLNASCLQASSVRCAGLSDGDCEASESCTSEIRCRKELSCRRYRTEEGCRGGHHCEWSSHPRF
jgi:hypothetical protein